jgi:carbon storage regulator
MLILSRRLGEQIVIAGEIRITIIAVKGNQIRVGVDAPPTVVVDRQEVAERKEAEGAGPVIGPYSTPYTRNRDRTRSLQTIQNARAKRSVVYPGVGGAAATAGGS